MHLTLPYPPSLNHYWRSVQGRVLISRHGRQYRHDVTERVRSQLPEWDVGEFVYPSGMRIALRMQICPPDRRRRDLDNAQKALLDSLAHAGLYADDSQIDFLVAERGPVVRGGVVRVSLESLENIHGAIYGRLDWLQKPHCPDRPATPADNNAEALDTHREIELPAVQWEPRRGSILRAGGGLLAA